MTESARYVVYGTGAIGGAVGAALHATGEKVSFIARPEQVEVIRRDGLSVTWGEEKTVIQPHVVVGPDQLDPADLEVVLLAVGSQHTRQALRDLRAVTSQAAIVCLQNGVDNERQALRAFEEVYGVSVYCPASHLAPGVIRVHTGSPRGSLDLGRIPTGTEPRAVEIANAFRSAGFSSTVRSEIMPWKYSKLLRNLFNAVDAACRDARRGGPVDLALREEGEACLRAGGIEFVAQDEVDKVRVAIMETTDRNLDRQGSSSWQALARGSNSIETDYLNGEIVLLGRLHGIPTPANQLMQHLAEEMIRGRLPPRSLSNQQLVTMLTERKM